MLKHRKKRNYREEKGSAKNDFFNRAPKLLNVLDVEGATVTIDAMGCQREIAEKIAEKGAEYVLALKGNQGALSEEVENYFDQADAIHFVDPMGKLLSIKDPMEYEAAKEALNYIKSEFSRVVHVEV